MKDGNEIKSEVYTETDGERIEEKVLVISEVRNAVVLPYTTEELEKGLRDDPDCADMYELIRKRYTVPLSRYRCGCVSRFKETFALVRKREKKSAFTAFCLAAEMFFTRFLHPAVITACKNTDWLDVYLDCLDKNELDEFPFFGIRCEPEKRKQKRKSVSEKSDKGV